MTTARTLAQCASYARMGIGGGTRCPQRVGNGDGLRSLIVCAFGDLALPSSSEKPIHLATTPANIAGAA
jgi:hypothetical protein